MKPVQECLDHDGTGHVNDARLLIVQRWLAEALCRCLAEHGDPHHEDVDAAFAAYHLWCETHGADIGWNMWKNPPLSVRCVRHDEERRRLAQASPVFEALMSLYGADSPEFWSASQRVSETVAEWQRLQEEVG